MTTEDPLQGAGSNLPPVPLTAPPTPATINPELTETTRPRHAVDRRLVMPGGETIDVGASEVEPSTTELAARIKSVDDRHRLNTAFLAAGIVAALLFAMLVAYLQHVQRMRVDELSSRLTAGDTERARIDGQLRSAACDVITGMRGTYSSAGRDANPTGTGRYDALFAQLAQGANTLNCDAG